MKGEFIWQRINKSTPSLVRAAGEIRALAHQGSLSSTQKAAAQAAGRKTAINQNAEHIIHNKDGKIGSRNSYGNDPHPPKG